MAGVAGNWESIESAFGDTTVTEPDVSVTAEGSPPDNVALDATTTTSSFDPDEGWERGACVRDNGATVALASCSLPNDGQVIATASADFSCPDDTTHTVDLESGVACMRLDDYVVVEGFDASTCAFDGIPLYGDVYFTDSSFSADMVVAIEDSSFLADLTVVGVDSSFGADRCGLWYIVDSPMQADFSVAATESSFGADFTIAIGDSTFDAGT